MTSMTMYESYSCITKDLAVCGKHVNICIEMDLEYSLNTTILIYLKETQIYSRIVATARLAYPKYPPILLIEYSTQWKLINFSNRLTVRLQVMLVKSTLNKVASQFSPL